MKYSVIKGDYLEYIKTKGNSLKNSLPVRRIQEAKADYYIVKENNKIIKDYIVYSIENNYIVTISLNDMKNSKMIKEILQVFKDNYEKITIKLIKENNSQDSEGFSFESLNHEYYGMQILFKVER